MAVNLLRPPISLFDNNPFPSTFFSRNNLITPKRCNRLSSIPQLPPLHVTTQQQAETSSSSSSSSAALSSLELQNQNLDFPIMVNGCTGKMGKAVIEAAVSAGLQVVPISFSSDEESGQIVQVGGRNIRIHGPSEREGVLASVFEAHPDLIVVDYTVPDAVNDNAELYCKIGVPFVMGTTGGDRERLYKTGRLKSLCFNITTDGKTGHCISCCHGNNGRAVSWGFLRI